MPRIIRSCFLSIIIFLVIVGPSTTMADEQGVDQVDEQALEILARSNNFLTKLKQFRVTAEFGFDVLQDTGQKIEFGSRQEITVQRPDHFRVNFTRRDGVNGSVVYDGKEVVLFNPEQAVYAKAPFKGKIDAAFDFLSEELQRPVPLRDFLSSDLNAILMAKMESALYVDESTVGGVLCDHLAMRNDRVDFQLWVTQGDQPLPHRVIITYKNEEAQPQFWAQFLKWEISPEITEGSFSYVPPKEAERIPFAVLDVDMPKEGGQP